MTDGVTLQSSTLASPSAGTKVATDDCGTPGHVQLVKLATSTDGDATALTASTTDGLLVNLGANNDVVISDGGGSITVDGSLSASPATLVRLSATPTISTSAYLTGEALGSVMTFSSAAAVSGGAISVVAVQIADKDQERAAIDLVLFDRNPASGTFTDNGTFDPTDTELAQIIGVIPITGADYSNFSDNAVAHVDCAVHGKLNGTDLFGAMITRSTPTYTATSDIVVTLSIRQG